MLRTTKNAAIASNIDGSCAIPSQKGRPFAQSKRFRRENETSLRMMISSNIRTSPARVEVGEKLRSKKEALAAACRCGRPG
jgi:hypothetical protein